MFWIFLFITFFTFKTNIVLADSPTLSWESGGTSDARRGDQFDINLDLTNLSSGTTYYVGAKGGLSSDNLCLTFLKYKDNWYNGCNVFSSTNLPYVTQNGTLTMSLKIDSSASSGTYYLYGYIYDAGGTLLATSSSRSITINDPLPTNTPSPSPTITPTPKPTSTPTPYQSPTPIIPTPEPLATDVPSSIIATAVPTLSLLPTNTTKKSGNSIILPFIIIIVLGALIFIATLYGPKIIEKIKSKKQPPQIPPQENPTTPNISTTEIPPSPPIDRPTNFQQ